MRWVLVAISVHLFSTARSHCGHLMPSRVDSIFELFKFCEVLIDVLALLCLSIMTSAASVTILHHVHNVTVIC